MCLKTKEITKKKGVYGRGVWEMFCKNNGTTIPLQIKLQSFQATNSSVKFIYK